MSDHFFSFESIRGKRVFVTGHTGFKGSWLSLWLSRLGCQVAGYALEPPTNPSNFDVCDVSGVLHQNTFGDLRDLSHLSDAIDRFQPDLIMHLAAQSVVRHGYDNPLETFTTNIIGTANVLEAVRTIGRPCAVFCVTSDKCYENREQAWGYRECDHLGESDPYGASKGAAELVIRSYRKSYFPIHSIREHGVWLASGRAGNVIGGGDWTEHGLIADCIRAFSRGEDVEIRNPAAQRPWQHVLQCLSGYLAVSARLLERQDPGFCSAWNFGPVAGDELPVRQVVGFLTKFWERAGWRDVGEPGQIHESQILRLSIDKAMWQLGWRPGWNVFEALQHTAEWFKAWDAGKDSMREVCFSQIDAYEQRLFESRNAE